jgi:hypothetical protein
MTGRLLLNPFGTNEFFFVIWLVIISFNTSDLHHILRMLAAALATTSDNAG